MFQLFYVLLFITLSFPAGADDLLSLYQRAVLSSPELNGSEYAVEIANAQEDQAFGKLLPKVEVNGNYSYNQLHRQLSAGIFTSHYDQLPRPTGQCQCPSTFI